MNVRSSNRNRWILAALVVAVACIGCFAALLYHQARVEAGRQFRHHYMYQSVVAIEGYDLHYQRMPKAVVYDDMGHPLYSWRVAILPFVGIPATISDSGLAWDHPLNVPITSQPLPLYCFRNDSNTNIVAVTGDGTAFDSMATHRFQDIPPDTIVLIEVANSSIPWAAPGDLDIAKLSDSVSFGTDGTGVHIAFADRTIWYLRRDTPLKKLEVFFRIEGAKQHDRDELLRSYVIAP